MKVFSIAKVTSSRYGQLMDFVVSGKSLLAELERREYDLVPRLSGGLVPIDQQTRAHLLLEEEDDLPDGRVGIYTCPCGDYGCGVVSVTIEKDGDHIVWHDFRYRNDYDDEVVSLEKLGPFKFMKQDYRNAIIGDNSSS